MKKVEILATNKEYWNENADSWFGVTSLPEYGVEFVTENDLNLFGDVSGKTMLEIGCGSGHSLKYHADNDAGEVWGLDLSKNQIENAKKYLSENKYYPKLICASMEEESDIPEEYFDIVYSIYAIGWATDLQHVFNKIHSYMKKDGIFIFSWKHPLHSCVKLDNEKLMFAKSYFDESWDTIKVDDMDIILSSRKISTYINALISAGFVIEKMIEQTDEETMNMRGEMSNRSKKAQMIPLSFVFKVRKA
jgi:cyclopropane fatty-acyl-phospholipid synthase-like methyltransferase